jgi:hypothetical protein
MSQSGGCLKAALIVGGLLGFCVVVLVGVLVLLKRQAQERTAATPSTVASRPNPVNQELATSSVPKRNAALRSVIRQHEKPCSAISRSSYNGSNPDGSAAWSVDCGAHQYLVTIGPYPPGIPRVETCEASGACFWKS